MLYWIVTIILIYVTFTSFELSSDHWSKKTTCPKILGIPGCYIFVVSFLAAFICHYVNTLVSNNVYFLFIGIAGFAALIASVLELMGKTASPKTKSGTPLVYYLIGICVVLAVVKQLSF